MDARIVCHVFQLCCQGTNSSIALVLHALDLAFEMGALLLQVLVLLQLVHAEPNEWKGLCFWEHGEGTHLVCQLV